MVTDPVPAPEGPPPVERPGARGLTEKYENLLRMLQRQPGVWHVIHVSDRPSSVGAPLRAHDVTITRRRIDGQYYTYARWEPW